MKKFLVFSVLIIGCTTSNLQIRKSSVYIDKDNVWINDCPVRYFPGGECGEWKSITIRVVNGKFRNVLVNVKCYKMPNKELFGKAKKIVNARDDATFLV